MNYNRGDAVVITGLGNSMSGYLKEDNKDLINTIGIVTEVRITNVRVSFTDGRTWYLSYNDIIPAQPADIKYRDIYKLVEVKS